MEIVCFSFVFLVISVIAIAMAASNRRELFLLRQQMDLVMRRLDRPSQQTPETATRQSEAIAPTTPAATTSATPMVQPSVAVTPPIAPVVEQSIAAPPAGPVLTPPRSEPEPIAAEQVLASDELTEIEPSDEPQTIAPPIAPVPVAEPAPSRSLEEKVGTRLTVWIGAIALAFAGIYLVKFSVERGLLRPEVRMSMAALFGLLLLAGGEWMRSRARWVAQGLVAASVAILYAVLVAATNVHHFLPPSVGSVLMVVVTAAAVILSLRHGPFVALLGLIGGFLTPVLVGSEGSHPAKLFGYLIMLQVGMLAVTRKRNWWPLAGLTLLAAMIWAVVVLFFSGGDEQYRFYLGIFLLTSVFCFVLAAAPGRDQQAWGNMVIARILASLAVVLSLPLLGWLLASGDFSNTEWLWMGILSAGCIVLARLDAHYIALPLLAATFNFIMLNTWHTPLHDDQVRAVWLCLAFGTLFAVAGYAMMWGSFRPRIWAVLSVGAAVAYMLVAHNKLAVLPNHWPWALVPVILAAIYTIAAIPVAKRRELMHDGGKVLSVFVVGIFLLLAIAAAMQFEREWITVAWALLIPAMAFVDARLNLPPLRHTAGMFAAFVLVRLLLNVEIADYPLTDTIIFNWMLHGYGIPAIAFALAAWRFHRTQPGRIVTALTLGSIALTVALVSLQIRHIFHGSSTFQDIDPMLREWATYVWAWLALAIGLVLASNNGQRATIFRAGMVIALIAIIAGMLSLLFGHNPLWSREPVGETIIVNWLLYAYALPAALLTCLALLVGRTGETVVAQALGYLAMLFAVVFVTLEVRHGFSPDRLDIGRTDLVEWASYVIAWLTLAIVLQAVHRRWSLSTCAVTSLMLTALSIVVTVLALLLAFNPLLRSQNVGVTMIFNWVLYSYGTPAALAVILALRHRAAGERIMPNILGLYAIIMGFVLITLEVRQAFQGALLVYGRADNAEWYTYSVAWIVYGVLLLALGIMMQRATLRWASLAVMLAAVGKVFILDTAHLHDLYRVLSFLGLGLTLMALGYIYQRFVFRKRIDDTPTN